MDSVENLIIKAYELVRRPAIWTSDADRWVEDARPVLSALASALRCHSVSATRGRCIRARGHDGAEENGKHDFVSEET